MDLTTIIDEYNYFVALAKKLQSHADVCSQDVELLYNAYPNEEIVKNVRNSFISLYFSRDQTKYTYQGFRGVITLPPLQWDFIDTTKALSDVLFIVTLRGYKFFMKREEYTKDTDWILHEYFAGFNLPRLPTLGLVLGAYSCQSDGKETCKYKSDTSDGLNFVLYEFIDGKTLADLYYDMIDEGKDYNVVKSIVWHVVRIVWRTLNHMFSKVGFIHQDLHFGNIIVVDLGEEVNVEIGFEKFTTRYLPKIIDYGRSRIKVDGKIYSPRDDYLGIPAHTPYYDLRLLLRSFNRIENYSTWNKLGFEPIKENIDKDEYFRIMRDLPVEKLTKLYDAYEKRYPGSYDPKKPLLAMGENENYEPHQPCRGLADPVFENEVKYIAENQYYTGLREYQYQLRRILEEEDIREIYVALKGALKLGIKHKFHFDDSDEDWVIDAVFTGTMKVMLDDIQKIISVEEFKKLEELYEKYSKLKL